MKNLSENIIFKHLAGYVFSKDLQSKYLACNENLSRLLGLKNPSEIQGKTDQDLIFSPDVAKKMLQDDLVIFNGQHSSTCEYQLNIPQQNRNFMILRVDRQALYDSNNKIIGLSGIAVDITEQKILEEIADSKNHFAEDIIYNLPGLVYWKNTQSQYIGFNKNVVTLSGLSAEKLYGKSDIELNWGQKQAEEFQTDDEEIMRTGVIKITEHEIPIKRTDGNSIFVRTEKSRLYNRKGEIAGVLGVALDITDQKILEGKLIKESQAKTEFIRNMEHDIRTPLGGIFTISTLLEKKEENEEIKELLNMTALAAKELLDYCNDIIEFSRLESGIFPLIAKEFDLKKLIDSVIKMETPAAKSKNLSLEVIYSKKVPEIVINDQYRIQRILINLLSNAVKFTQKGSIQTHVEIAKPTDKQNMIILNITVKDTGIGIPKDKQTEIFKKFSRLIPASKGLYKGTGLGLNVIKQLVDELEGEIDLESTPNVGSSFIVTLPFHLKDIQYG